MAADFDLLVLSVAQLPVVHWFSMQMDPVAQFRLQSPKQSTVHVAPSAQLTMQFPSGQDTAQFVPAPHSQAGPLVQSIGTPAASRSLPAST